MSTPMKLACLAFGAAVLALVLLLPAIGPNPDPPGSVARITLQPSPGGDERGTKRTDPVSSDRPAARSRRGDRRPPTKARPAGKWAATSGTRSVARGDSVARADAAPPGKAPSNDPPAPRSRPDAPATDRSSAPRSVPVRDIPEAPEASPASNDSDPAETEPADPPDPSAPHDPPDPPDPTDVDPTTGSVDPAEEPDPVGGDPAAEAP
jgi:hypothetical protein